MSYIVVCEETDLKGRLNWYVLDDAGAYIESWKMQSPQRFRTAAAAWKECEPGEWVERFEDGLLPCLFGDRE